MAKDKKKAGKKSKAKGGAKARLKEMAGNPLVADLVAAGLVAAAAALKDTAKAKALAAKAGDEVEAMAKEGAERGSKLWKLALDVGRRALDDWSDKPAPKKPAKARKPARARKS